MRFLFTCILCTLLLSAGAARAGEGEAADLRLRLAKDAQIRYAWDIEYGTQSKGTERGKPLDLRVDKDLKLNVRLQGIAPPSQAPIGASLRFDRFELEEKRKVGEALQSRLRVDRRQIFLEENGKVQIDSLNDIGLEKITDYQRNLRGLERHEVHLGFETTGKQAHVAGDTQLVETLYGHSSQGLFPVLAGQEVKPGEGWTDAFGIPMLGELKLDQPAKVTSRLKFAGWIKKDGKALALVDVVSFWESTDLSGRDEAGLEVTITRLDGMGAGTCTFDPATGVFEEGTMTFQLKYRLEGRREGEKTELEVEGKSRTKFKRMELGEAGPKPE